MFVAAVALVPGAVRALAAHAADGVRRAIAHAGDPSPSASLDAGALGAEVAALALPVLVASALVAAVAYVVQTGGFVASKRLAPDFTRLNPIRGLRSIVSPVRLFAVARALLGAAIVSWLAYRALAAHLVDLAHVAGRLEHVAAIASELAHGVARDAALVGLLFAVVDVVVVRNAWRKRLMMTVAEVKREHKESEGDPQTKAARERAQHEMLAAATIGNVRHASVVIVNPTHLASALRYDEGEGDAAPVVVASGEGDLAARIVEAARDYGVPVVRDVPLAHALAELQVGDLIPEALYEAVAEILRDAWEEKAT